GRTASSAHVPDSGVRSGCASASDHPGDPSVTRAAVPAAGLDLGWAWRGRTGACGHRGRAPAERDDPPGGLPVPWRGPEGCSGAAPASAVTGAVSRLALAGLARRGRGAAKHAGGRLLCRTAYGCTTAPSARDHLG